MGDPNPVVTACSIFQTLITPLLTFLFNTCTLFDSKTVCVAHMGHGSYVLNVGYVCMSIGSYEEFAVKRKEVESEDSSRKYLCIFGSIML